MYIVAVNSHTMGDFNSSHKIPSHCENEQARKRNVSFLLNKRKASIKF